MTVAPMFCAPVTARVSELLTKFFIVTEPSSILPMSWSELEGPVSVKRAWSAPLSHPRAGQARQYSAPVCSTEYFFHSASTDSGGISSLWACAPARRCGWCQCAAAAAAWTRESALLLTCPKRLEKKADMVLLLRLPRPHRPAAKSPAAKGCSVWLGPEEGWRELLPKQV